MELAYMPWFSDRAGSAGGSRLAPPTGAAFHVRDRVGTPMLLISRLNSPACTPPANASPTPLRAPTHGSGPPWSLAFRCRTFPFLVPCRFIPAHHEGTEDTKTHEDSRAPWSLPAQIKIDVAGRAGRDSICQSLRASPCSSCLRASTHSDKIAGVPHRPGQNLWPPAQSPTG